MEKRVIRLLPQIGVHQGNKAGTGKLSRWWRERAWQVDKPWWATAPSWGYKNHVGVDLDLYKFNTWLKLWFFKNTIHEWMNVPLIYILIARCVLVLWHFSRLMPLVSGSLDYIFVFTSILVNFTSLSSLSFVFLWHPWLFVFYPRGIPTWVFLRMLAKLPALSEIHGCYAVMIFYEVLSLPYILCDWEKIVSVSEVLCLLKLLSSKSFCESVTWGTCP